MIIFPAIDILNGKCVRLVQGDYNQETVYGDSPVDMAKTWENKGAEYIHIVDLNAAKSGESVNNEVIKQIANHVNIPIQVGGGIRSIERVADFLDNGVDRVIIGTAAIKDPAFLRAAVDLYGEKIAVSIDARNGYVATDGWTDTSTALALDVLKELAAIGVATVVYTDIAKDGMLEGPNLSELQMIRDNTSINIIASGGISTKADVIDVKQVDVYGAIIGKALYEGTLLLEDIVGANK